MEVSSDFGERCVTCSVGHVVRDGACAPWTAALCTHETNSADVGRLECANGMTRFVNCDTRAWTTSCAYVDVDTERVGFYADADAVDATCDTENGCASSAAQGTASHTAQGAAVVSARGACGAHCTPSTRRRAMHALSSTRGRGALQQGDVVPRVRTGAFLKNDDRHPRSSNCVTCTDDTKCVVSGDGNVVGRNCITSGDVHRAVSKGWRSCSAWADIMSRTTCALQATPCVHETPSGVLSFPTGVSSRW